MKILKRILLAVLGIIVIILVFALFIDKEFSLSKEVLINKPKQQVFDYAKIIKNQEEHSVWVMKDPNIKIASQVPMEQLAHNRPGKVKTKMLVLANSRSLN
jgi:ABC-type lipoprotein release transport system permease subunit